MRRAGWNSRLIVLSGSSGLPALFTKIKSASLMGAVIRWISKASFNFGDIVMAWTEYFVFGVSKYQLFSPSFLLLYRYFKLLFTKIVLLFQSISPHCKP